MRFSYECQRINNSMHNMISRQALWVPGPTVDHVVHSGLNVSSASLN